MVLVVNQVAGNVRNERVRQHRSNRKRRIYRCVLEVGTLSLKEIIMEMMMPVYNKIWRLRDDIGYGVWVGEQDVLKPFMTHSYRLDSHLNQIISSLNYE
jgi:hypothetical protein